MKLKRIFAVLAIMMLLTAMTVPAYADPAQNEPAIETEAESSVTGTKAMASAIMIAVVAAVGALGMSFAIAKSVDGMARQPEAAGKIQTGMMLGLVFIETAIIYALIVAILIIFVL